MSEEMRKKFEEQRATPKGVCWLDYENQYTNIYERHAEEQAEIYQMLWVEFKAGAESVQEDAIFYCKNCGYVMLNAEFSCNWCADGYSFIEISKKELAEKYREQYKEIQQLKADKAELVEAFDTVMREYARHYMSASEITNIEQLLTKHKEQ